MAATASAAPAVPESPTESRPSLMRNRTFLSIWAGHAISVLGDGFNSVAMGLWVLQTTGSASAMATVVSVRVIVGILLGAVAGTVADRVDRRKLMIVMDLLRVGLVGAVAYLVFRSTLNIPVLLMLAGAIAVCGNFFSPAFQASLANIVDKEDLPKASSLLQMTNMLAQVIGPVLGGTVVGLFGGWTALTGDALSFLLSALAILAGGAFASPRQTPGEGRSFWADMKEGLNQIRQQPLVRSIVSLAPVVNFFGNSLMVLIPVIAVKIWLTNSYQFGILNGALPLGFAVGAGLIMALSGKLKRRGYWMMIAMIAAGLLSALSALSPSFVIALPFGLGCGVALAVVNVLFQITLQAEVPTEVQGRVFGTLGSLVSIASPLSMMAAGFLADVFNPAHIAAFAGLGITVSALGGLLIFPALRAYK